MAAAGCRKSELKYDSAARFHAVYRIDVGTAISRRTDELAFDLEQRLRDDKLDVEVVRDGERTRVIRAPAEVQPQALSRAVAPFPLLFQSDNRLVVRPSEVSAVREAVLRDTVETVRGRLDKLGAKPKLSLAGELLTVDLRGV